MKGNNTDPSAISDEQFERKYARIKNKILKNKNIVDNPIAVVLGGQPGAGKSNIYNIYKERFEGNIVELDCDAFRKYHPNFKKLHKIYGDNDGEKTNPFIFKVVDRLVDELSDQGYNMIIESSLKSPHTALENGEKLPQKGYNVELAVMATPKSKSWSGTLERYNEVKAAGGQPRAVPKEVLKNKLCKCDYQPNNEPILKEQPNRARVYNKVCKLLTKVILCTLIF